MIMIKCSSVILKNHNLYTEIDNVSMNFIKPLQPEHAFTVMLDPVLTSKTQSKVEVKVLNSEEEIVALGLVSAVH